MNAWIFQGNPDRFDIDGYLQNLGLIYWSVTKFEDQINLGDSVFIWRAKGHKEGISGIIAKAVVIEKPCPQNEVSHPERRSESLWVKPENDVSNIKAGLALEDVRLTPDVGMLTLEQIISIPALAQLQILTVRTGTNFKLSENQFQCINNLWGAAQQENDEGYSSQYSSVEGKVRLQIHKVRERDPKLARIAKQQFVRLHGRLYCELCGFSFAEIYGDAWKELIEVHHIKPLHLVDNMQTTEIENLLIVCANCHRALHYFGDAEDNLTLLRHKLQNKNN
jgi:hypothetical protein